MQARKARADFGSSESFRSRREPGSSMAPVRCGCTVSISKVRVCACIPNNKSGAQDEAASGRAQGRRPFCSHRHPGARPGHLTANVLTRDCAINFGPMIGRTFWLNPVLKRPHTHTVHQPGTNEVRPAQTLGAARRCEPRRLQVQRNETSPPVSLAPLSLPTAYT